MMGNLMKETGVVERITKTAGNELMNIITIFLGFSVGCTTNAETFLTFRTVEVHRPGHRGLRGRHGGRRAAGQGHVLCHPRQDQPSHRFGRRFGRADGRPRQPEGRAGI